MRVVTKRVLYLERLKFQDCKILYWKNTKRRFSFDKNIYVCSCIDVLTILTR